MKYLVELDIIIPAHQLVIDVQDIYKLKPPMRLCGNDPKPAYLIMKNGDDYRISTQDYEHIKYAMWVSRHGECIC